VRRAVLCPDTDPPRLKNCGISEDEIREVVEAAERWEFPHEDHQRVLQTQALAYLSGTYPPVWIGKYQNLDTWPQHMGLVLLIGYCPRAMADMSLLELVQLKGESELRTQLTDHIVTDRTAPRPTGLPSYRFYRLDGLVRGHGGFPVEMTQEPWFGMYVKGRFKWTCREIMPVWLSSDLTNEDRLPPSEFVRWAINHRIHVPWFELAKRYFPHLLPELADKDRRDPVPSTEPRKSGRRVDEKMEKAYWYADNCIKENPKRAKAEIVKEAIEKHFPEANEYDKKGKMNSLDRYLTPSGRPKWAKVKG